MKSKTGSTCQSLTKNSENFFLKEFLENSKKGITLEFSGDEEQISIEFKLYCNYTLGNPVFEADAILDENEKKIVVVGSAKEACPVYDGHYIYEKIAKFKYLYIVVAFVIGLVECFYGYKLLKHTLFLVSEIGLL